MDGDHALLIGWNHPNGAGTGGRTDPLLAACIRRGVDLDTEPSRLAADSFANRARIFTYAGGEDQDIETPGSGGERAEFTAYSVNEKINRLPRVRIIRKWLRLIGPGFITGASDDDPSGIATYSQAGAKFGPAMLWTSVQRPVRS